MSTDPKKNDGFKEYQRLQGRTPLRKYPWKTMAKNVAVIGAGAGLGYLTAGALTHAAMKTRIKDHLARMSPSQRMALWTGLGGTAAAAGVTARALATAAGRARVAEELAYQEAKRRQEAGEKSASVDEVHELYLRALG